MARQIIGIGSTANDGTGDTLREAGTKINNNIAELYNIFGDSDSIVSKISFTENTIVHDSAYNTVLAFETASADRTITFPNATDTVVGKATTDTLTNKTLTSAVLTTPQINDTSADHQYVVAVSELAADRIVTLPQLGAGDEFVFKAHTATLTNKTLTSPILTTAKVITSLNDTNGNELAKVTATSSAVNEITIANAASGSGPTVSATGGDTNVPLNLTAKGTGRVIIDKSALSTSTITANGTASATAGFIICNSASPIAVALADGSTAGEIKIFVNKNAGLATVTPVSFAQGATTFALANNEGCTLIWDGDDWNLIGNQSLTAIA